MGQDAGAPFWIAEDVVVPEPEHPVAFSVNDRGPRRIGFLGMLSAVNFDHEPRAMAGEVDDHMADRHLTSPAGTRHDLAQQPPHCPFGVGHLTAELPGAEHVARWRMLLHTLVLAARSPPSKLR